MTVIEGLLAELEQEAQTTRRVLERVRQEHLTWKPHPKSLSLGQLALHVATVPGNVAEFAATDIVTEPPSFVHQQAATAAELVPSLTESVAKAKRALGGFDDARMGAMWRLQSGGREIMAMPRVALVRAIMLNHWYHHRGQLLVYLRLLDQPVPSVYGPTADENPFAAERAGCLPTVIAGLAIDRGSPAHRRGVFGAAHDRRTACPRMRSDDRERRPHFRGIQRRLDRCETRAGLDFLSRRRHVKQLGGLVDLRDERRRQQDGAPAHPVARVEQQVADPPAVVADEEVVDVTDLAVLRRHVETGHLLDASQVPRRGALRHRHGRRPGSRQQG